MILTLPDSPMETLLSVIPLITLLIGLAYFFAPTRMLGSMGLEAKSGVPSAIGEGRSSFAGFLIGLSLACLLLQEPSVQQPALTFALGASWLIAALGKVIYIALDGARSKNLYITLLLAFIMGALALWLAEPIGTNLNTPGSNAETYVFFVAILTVLYGLAALVFPRALFRLFGLQAKISKPWAYGSLRGELAGFHIGVGGTYLFASNTLFIGLALGICWICTVFGRMIAMLSDRGNTIGNWILLLIEIGFASVVIASILGFVS